VPSSTGSDVRIGARLGIDVGRARIGVARCDAGAVLAVPVETVARAADGGADVRRILELADEYEVIELVVGNPLSLSGAPTASTDDAIGFAQRLADAGAPVRLVDERLSTVSAQQALRASGKSSRKQRPIVDQVAAVIILQHAIDAERTSGIAPGRALDTEEGPTPL
jgi:putative Holliday junction resolvase